MPSRQVILMLLLAATSFSLGVAVALRLLPAPDDWQESQTIQRMAPSLQLPTPELTPEEIVRTQINAIQSYSRDPARMWQCYVFASPTNRVVTGPFPRFQRMICSPPFERLLAAEHVVVGRSTIRGDYATVLVTVVAADRRASVFRFYLTKQREGTHVGCWMTEQVVHVREDSQTEPDMLAASNVSLTTA